MQEFLDFSKELAGASGDVIMRYFRSDIAVETKSDESPVTIADKQAEEIMREMIMKAYPAHGIIGEEFGNHNEDAEYQWVLDPIDGTKSFVSGTFLFGTLIGLMKDGQPIVGAIHHPLTSHLLIGAGGEARATWLCANDARYGGRGGLALTVPGASPPQSRNVPASWDSFGMAHRPGGKKRRGLAAGNGAARSY